MKINTYRITRIALCTAFVAVGAMISGSTTPPVSLQTLFIFITSLLLRPLDSFISMCVYLLLGIVGLPIFSSFQGGIGVLLGLNGGYLISFPVIAPLTSRMLKRVRNGVFAHSLVFTVATLISYIMGAAWIQIMGYYDGSFSKMLSACVLPFIPFDALKIAAAVFVTTKLKKALANERKKN